MAPFCAFMPKYLASASRPKYYSSLCVNISCILLLIHGGGCFILLLVLFVGHVSRYSLIRKLCLVFLGIPVQTTMTAVKKGLVHASPFL